MKSIDKTFDPEAFWQQVGSAAFSLLMLDYDGTLAPFRLEREQAVPYPGVRERLQQIMGYTRTRVVIISGRSVRDLVPLLNLTPPPEIWGTHGMERLGPDNEYKIAELSVDAAKLLHQAVHWMRENELGERIERKPGALAVHWRGLEERQAESIRAAVHKKWEKPVRRNGMELKPFDGGIEFRAKNRDKGSAVTTILSEMPQSGIVAAYLGDDLTDEDAFTAIKNRGYSFLVREELRETAADGWLVPPEELLDFLDRWLQAVGA